MRNASFRMSQPKVKPLTRKKPFYGWFALAGVMLVVLTVGGLFVNTFGVFLPVVSGEMGWGRGTVALSLSLGIMAFGLPSPIFGLIVTRLGPRLTLITGNLLAVIGMACLSLVQEVWQMYALYIFIGFTAGFGGFVACSSLVANWFVKKRSLALGMFTASGGLGGFIFPPLATALIEGLGWRMAWVTLASIVLVIGVILGGVVLARNKPEDKGQHPDGIEPSPYLELEKKSDPVPASRKPSGNLMLDLLRSPVIWFVGGFTAANAFAMGTITTHQVSYIQDIGYAPMTAATTVSLFSIMSFTGSIAFGALALKLNVRLLALAGFCIELLAIVLLLSSANITMIYIYAIMIGLGNGALTTAMPTFVGTYFHGKEYSQAFGIILPFQVVSQSIAASVSGGIYDAAGSYIPAFYMVGACFILGILFVALARLPKHSPVTA